MNDRLQKGEGDHFRGRLPFSRSASSGTPCRTSQPEDGHHSSHQSSPAGITAKLVHLQGSARNVCFDVVKRVKPSKDSEGGPKPWVLPEPLQLPAASPGW